MRRAAVLFAGAVLSASASLFGAARAAPQTWELRDGRWEQTAVAPATQPVSDPILDRAGQLLERRQHRGAHKLLLAWLKERRTSPLRDRAIFLLGESWYQYGNRVLAFYYFDEVMDEYPESQLYYSALQRQYDIADAYLNGYKRRFLGVPMFRAEDEAIDMLFRIQARSPGSPLAEKALLRTADYYFATSQFDVAGDAYAAYAKNYPRSPVIARVRLRQAYSTLAQFRGTKFDATPLADSRSQLTDLQMGYPDLAEQENTADVLSRIDATFARKLYYTADFYRRTNEPVAAVYTYRYLIKTYPASAEADRARYALGRFDQKYLNTPEPAGGGGYLPTTMPVGPTVGGTTAPSGGTTGPTTAP